MSDTKPEQLEATFINIAALLMDLLVASKTVTTPVLVQSLDQLGQELGRRGYGQSVGHMIHFQEFLKRREEQRSEVQSLLKAQPQGQG